MPTCPRSSSSAHATCRDVARRVYRSSALMPTRSRRVSLSGTPRHATATPPGPTARMCHVGRSARPPPCRARRRLPRVRLQRRQPRGILRAAGQAPCRPQGGRGVVVSCGRWSRTTLRTVSSALVPSLAIVVDAAHACHSIGPTPWAVGRHASEMSRPDGAGTRWGQQGVATTTSAGRRNNATRKCVYSSNQLTRHRPMGDGAPCSALCARCRRREHGLTSALLYRAGTSTT